jgi:hypothetical protein
MSSGWSTPARSALLEYVVAIEEDTLREDHPDRLASQHMLATMCQAGGQTHRALELLEHIVARRERALSEEHPDRLASQHAYAIAYRLHQILELRFSFVSDLSSTVAIFVNDTIQSVSATRFAGSSQRVLANHFEASRPS